MDSRRHRAKIRSTKMTHATLGVFVCNIIVVCGKPPKNAGKTGRSRALAGIGRVVSVSSTYDYITSMTKPTKPQLCQAPGCGQPIKEERLRRHPTTKTCSDDCRDAYRCATMSRAEREKRHAERVQKAAKRRVARALEAVRATGWEYVSHDHYLRLACSKGLAARFDASIPQEHTRASWLCEIVETLMSTQGAKAQALNQQVAQAGPLERQDDPTLGDQEIRSRISSFLWADIVKRAKKDHAASPTDWLRKMVARAVQPPMDWTKQTDPVHLPKGAPQPKSPQEWKAASQTIDLESIWARRLRDDQTRRRAIELDGQGQLYQDMCREQHTYYPVRLPKKAPRPKSPQEWKAASQTGLRDRIWTQWKATAPKGVKSLQQLGQLYQEMHRAEQAYVQVRNHLQARGEKPERAEEIAEKDCLRWEGLEEQVNPSDL